MRRCLLVLAATGLLASACGGGTQGTSGSVRTPSPLITSPAPTTAGPTTGSPIPSPAPEGDLSSARVRVVQVASLEQPVAMATRSGDDTIYVAEQSGKVRAVRDGRVSSTPVLDLSEEVSFGGEQGLLGIAFSPDGELLYADFTDTDGHTRVAEFAMRDGRAVPASRRDVVFVEQPFSNHNGGQIAFGPDGMLYVALGDGGGGGDPLDNGQSLDTLLGKILRIDPRPGRRHPYGVPRDNPFVGRDGVRPEIWAYGLRNPWRFTFDRETGDMWIGDVGQSAVEEIDFEPADSGGGRNYGWNRLEGTRPFEGDAPQNAVPPIFEYERAGGACSVTGGYVYRGNRIPALAGSYVFGDFCQGRLMALHEENGKVIEERPLGPTVPSLSSFGEDESGELYVMSLEGGLYRLGPA